MSDTTMHVPIPPALDHRLLREPAYTIRAHSPGGAVLLHYDPNRHCAGVCYLANEVWAIWGPLPFAEFTSSLRERGIRVDDGDDLARWIAACSPVPSGELH